MEIDTNMTKSNEGELKTSKIKETYQQINYNLMHPSVEFEKLSKKDQIIVEKADNGSEKQYEVGWSLIEGKNEFPRNIKLGKKS